MLRVVQTVMDADDVSKIPVPHADADVSSTVITASEWRALLTEDPQADPDWPASWLGRLRIGYAQAECDASEPVALAELEPIPTQPSP